MANAALGDKLHVASHPISPLAGVLSYLVPGLGQIATGRVGKGVLFLVCVYGLFFYGLLVGEATVDYEGRTYYASNNVFLPDAAEKDPAEPGQQQKWPPLAQNLYTRPQFAGQFWAGVVVWPAILQYMSYDRDAVLDIEAKLDNLYQEKRRAEQGQEPDRDETLRTLQAQIDQLEHSDKFRHRLFGHFMREPSPVAVNLISNAGDKRWDLAWVYTVIAGVLNIMVIYDAIFGPAFAAAAADRAGRKD